MIEKLEGHRSSVNCLAVANHYQKLLIAAGAEDGSVRVWDMSNGRVVMGIHGFADSSSDEVYYTLLFIIPDCNEHSSFIKITSIAFFENNLYASAGTSVFQFEIGHAGPTVKTSPDSRFDRVVKDEINQVSSTHNRSGHDVGSSKMYFYLIMNRCRSNDSVRMWLSWRSQMILAVHQCLIFLMARCLHLKSTRM